MYKKIRNSKFEVLKIVGMLLIVFSHIIPYYNATFDGYINIASPTMDISIWVLQLFRYLGQIGNGLFITCSCYILYKSSFRLSKIIYFILETLFISYVFLIFSIIFIPSLSFKEIIKSLLPITFLQSWFITCYLVFYLILFCQYYFTRLFL